MSFIPVLPSSSYLHYLGFIVGFAASRLPCTGCVRRAVVTIVGRPHTSHAATRLVGHKRGDGEAAAGADRDEIRYLAEAAHCHTQPFQEIANRPSSAARQLLKLQA
jgi:hypothetical protein